MSHFSLQAIGVDQRGIVAKVTSVLAGQGCNLGDSRMAILRGQFAITLIVDAPEAVSEPLLKASFAPLEDELGLKISIRQLTETEHSEEVAPTLSISVHGADRPGIVSAVTSKVAELGGNIVDLSTYEIEGDDRPIYVLLLTVESGDATEQQFKEAMKRVADSLAVTCVVQSTDDDRL